MCTNSPLTYFLVIDILFTNTAETADKQTINLQMNGPEHSIVSTYKNERTMPTFIHEEQSNRLFFTNLSETIIINNIFRSRKLFF